MGDSERPTAIHRVQVTRGFHRFVIPVDGEPEDVRLDPDTWALFRGELEHR